MSSNFPPPLQLKRDNIPTVTITSPTSPSLKSPRTPRFAEATSVHSPIEPSKVNPFKDPLPPTNHYFPQPQVSDVGFGYMHGARAGHESVEIEETDNNYLPPTTPRMAAPLKSALKSPGAAPRNMEGMLSPTFTIMSPTQFEEDSLERAEKTNTKEQKRDLRSKIRVRYAKIFMRGINFSCSLIVLSMLSTSLTIFHATKGLPPRNKLPPWAANTKTWPQLTLLSISCVSLAICVFVIITNCRRGHRRAEKVGMYYTTFSVAIFIFSIVMWIVGAVVLNQSKANGGGNDIWGWSCKNNRRSQLFQEDVSYSLICRLQNWSLICCIIEVVVELFTLMIYGITFYRYYTKRRLRKTMAIRDRARSDLYLAQLKLQSAPNTPGFPLSPGILSPRDGGWVPPQGYDNYNTDKRAQKAAEAGFQIEEEGVQYATVSKKPKAPAPFTLQAPPLAKKKNGGLDSQPASPAPTGGMQSMQAAMEERRRSHVPAAAGETNYGEVAIPGAYTPMSPAFPANVAKPPAHGFNFNASS